MQDRKLDVTARSPHESVREKRGFFDQHVDTCADCQPSLCWYGQLLWRATCLEALRLHAVPAPVTVLPLSQKGGE